ncbi:glycosyltransferase family 4 protein [Vibrio coralliilyticus]|uniref:glycosyltransferase family 4 protein n=1 Tax=Vibrio coralliilyticus TaxID=190893 RepID=UPI0039171E20
MKVAISVFGRFHVFNTAKELESRGVLNQFFTTYPKWMVKKFDIESETVSYPFLELLNRIRRKLFSRYWPESMGLKKVYDHMLAKRLKDDNDIYIAWGGFSYKSMKRAKELGQIVILEWGSTHPLYVKQVLKSEYDRFNIALDLNSDENIHWTLKAIEMADYISIPSSFVKRTFEENGVCKSKLMVNPYGVDLSSFRPLDKKDNVFRVIYCGTLSIQKGSHYLLQAIHELDLPNLQLWHIGSVKNEMKPFIHRYGSGKVHFKGSYPQSELYKLYSQGSVFVIPSIQDGLALVQLQAMACGLPLICSTNTGGDDLITKQGDEGYVIPIRSVEAIKEKITVLYNDPELLKEMSDKAIRKVSQGYTWEDYGNRYFKNLEVVTSARNIEA